MNKRLKSCRVWETHREFPGKMALVIPEGEHIEPRESKCMDELLATRTPESSQVHGSLEMIGNFLVDFAETVCHCPAVIHTKTSIGGRFR